MSKTNTPFIKSAKYNKFPYTEDWLGDIFFIMLITEGEIMFDREIINNPYSLDEINPYWISLVMKDETAVTLYKSNIFK